MNYPSSKREADLAAYNKHLALIREERGRQYATAEDSLSNLRNSDPFGGWRAAFIEAQQCMNRLRQDFLHRKSEINRKSFLNALDDLNNFAQIMKPLFEQEKK